MNRFIVCAVILTAASPLLADFESAAEHYRNMNYHSAFEGFMPLAEAGDARAQTVIAMMYKFGEAVDQDPRASYQWYLRAAEQGYAPAMFNVGDMLSKGEGVAADTDAAVTWLRRAAEAGFDRAAARLSELDRPAQYTAGTSRGLRAWSKDWNFRLPNSIRFNEPEQISEDAAFRAQVGAMRTRTAANRLWDWLTTMNPDVMRGLSPNFEFVESGRFPVYRVQAGPFADKGEADTFCERLKRRQDNAGCLVVQISGLPER